MELLKQNAEKQGYLKVILGPMFSGKTTELIRIYNRYTNCDISIVYSYQFQCFQVKLLN